MNYKQLKEKLNRIDDTLRVSRHGKQYSIFDSFYNCEVAYILIADNVEDNQLILRNRSWYSISFLPTIEIVGKNGINK